MSVETESTRARILDAAKQEFAAVGLAGGRVDAIARMAGCNKQLIYHYFGDKNGLFEAVMASVLADRGPLSVNTRADFVEQLGREFDNIPKRRAWLRLLMWEALANEDRPVVAEDARREHLCPVLENVERLQGNGVFDRCFPVRLLLLALMAMMVFPWMLPQMTRIVTGCSPADPQFRRDYLAVVQGIMRRLGACGRE